MTDFQDGRDALSGVSKHDPIRTSLPKKKDYDYLTPSLILFFSLLLTLPLAIVIDSFSNCNDVKQWINDHAQNPDNVLYDQCPTQLPQMQQLFTFLVFPMPIIMGLRIYLTRKDQKRYNS